MPEHSVTLYPNRRRQVNTMRGTVLVWRYFPAQPEGGNVESWHLLDASDRAVASMRRDEKCWRYSVELREPGFECLSNGIGSMGECAWCVEQAVRALTIEEGDFYPEHEKMAAVREKSQAIGEFLEWLEDERKPRIVLAVDSTQPEPYESSGLWPANIPIETLLAEFFGIDRDAISREKEAMVAALLEANRGREPKP